MEEINAVFQFSELYPGFCELIIASDIKKDATMKVTWLATQLNKTNHPHIRTKIIRYLSQTDTDDLIETSIKHALGQKIIIALPHQKQKRMSYTGRMTLFPKDISVTESFLNTEILEEYLLKQQQ